MTNDINFSITLPTTSTTQQSNHSNDVISIDLTHSTTTTGGGGISEPLMTANL